MKLDAIAVVYRPIKELEDDQWGQVESVVELDPSVPADALDGKEIF